MTTISDQERMERLERQVQALSIMVINLTRAAIATQPPHIQDFIAEADEAWSDMQKKIMDRFPSPQWSDFNARANPLEGQEND